MTSTPSAAESETARLLASRAIPVEGELDDHAAEVIIAKMLFLFSENERAPVFLQIDSLGGQFTSGVAIVDVVRERQSMCRTTCAGQAGGIAVAILACGTPGMRRIAKNATVSLTPLQPRPGGDATSSDLGRAEDALVDILAQCTRHDPSELRTHVRAGRRFDAAGALSYGLVDEIY